LSGVYAHPGVFGSFLHVDVAMAFLFSADMRIPICVLFHHSLCESAEFINFQEILADIGSAFQPDTAELSSFPLSPP